MKNKGQKVLHNNQFAYQRPFHMGIVKSEGVTKSERLLSKLCENTFLKLWSYPNPVNDEKKELCDLLAVFENHIFIFFDREKELLTNSDKDPTILWDRWKRKAIDSQIKTAHGAERYLKSKRKIYLDSSLETVFPLNLNIDEMIIHKIIVAHGAEKACKGQHSENVYGSLGIVYGHKPNDTPSFPFMIDVDKNNPVHIFDSFNLPIILKELDTIYDFTSYLDAKLDAINLYDTLAYCGEEDLLAHYYLNFDDSRNSHFIGTHEKAINGIMIGEGEWKDFINTKPYKNKKVADEISYTWDKLIQKTCRNALDGTLLGNTDIFKGESAIIEMAKEPRFSRRALSDHMLKSIKTFPDSPQPIIRNISFMPSFYYDKGYVFLQFKMEGTPEYKNDYRPIRQKLLEIACGSAKNKFGHLKKIIGIAVEPPKLSKTISEDFIVMDCTNWTKEMESYYDKENEPFKFFQTNSLKAWEKKVENFPSTSSSIKACDPNKLAKVKIGRNSPCPCDSGKKFKKCCGK